MFLSSAPEPMQIDRTHLILADHQCRFKTHSCLYCGGPGHILAN